MRLPLIRALESVTSRTALVAIKQTQTGFQDPEHVAICQVTNQTCLTVIVSLISQTVF